MLATRPITVGRGATAKTPGKALRGVARDENALHQIQTIGKGKLPPRTPGKPNLTELGRFTLGDKTPFPNQKNPGIAGKSGKQIILEVPGSAPRPSSTRKKVKLPQAGAKVMFQTPAPNGKAHWDVSDLEISVALSEDNLSSFSDDDDDFEYMPPTAIEPPYEPDFDFPDPQRMGETLLELFRLPPYQMVEASDVALSAEEEDQIFAQAGGEQTGDNWPRLDLGPLTSDDPFPPRPLAGKSAGIARRPLSNSPAAPALRIRPASTVPIISTRSRTQTPVTARGTPAPRTAFSRPATALLRHPAAASQPSTKPPMKATSKNTALTLPARKGTKPPVKAGDADGLDSLPDLPNTEDNFMFEV